jgi:hypothetical protein
VQAYIWGVPLVNGVALQRALVAAGVSLSEPSLLVFDHVLTPKQVIMTANSEVVYGMSAIDLGVTGPGVVEAPDGLFGVVIDVWNRGVVDIGIGPPRGQRTVLVPPGDAGDVPTDGYVVTRARDASSRSHVASWRPVRAPRRWSSRCPRCASSSSPTVTTRRLR